MCMYVQTYTISSMRSVSAHTTIWNGSWGTAKNENKTSTITYVHLLTSYFELWNVINITINLKRGEMCIFSCAEKQGLTCTSSPKDLQGINWNGSKDLNERVSINLFRHTNIFGTSLMRGGIMLTLWIWRSCRVWNPSSSLLSGELAPQHWDADADKEKQNHKKVVINTLYFNTCTYLTNLIRLSLQVLCVAPVSPYVTNTPLPRSL